MQVRPLGFLENEVYPWEGGAVPCGEKTWEGSEGAEAQKLCRAGTAGLS